MNNKGQLSLEYVFIFMLTLIIFSIISIPLFIESIENTNDIINVVKTENTLNELSSEVKYIYYSDIGTKKVKDIYIPSDMKLEYKLKSSKHYLYTKVKLNDNNTKEIYVEVPCKVTFKNNPNYYYSNLYNRYYYNVEFKWLEGNKTSNVDINFK